MIFKSKKMHLKILLILKNYFFSEELSEVIRPFLLKKSSLQSIVSTFFLFATN